MHLYHTRLANFLSILGQTVSNYQNIKITAKKYLYHATNNKGVN